MKTRHIADAAIGSLTRRELLLLAMAVPITACSAPTTPEQTPVKATSAPAAPGASSTAPSTTQTNWGTPYTIGQIGSLTGSNADTETSAKIGAEIAVEQINARGGILGRKLELIHRDDKLDPDEALRVAKELYLDRKVDAMILPHAGTVQAPIASYAKDNSILSFGAQGHDMYYMNDIMHPYYFLMGPTAMQEAGGLAQYVARRTDLKSYVTFAPDYQWGHSNVEAFIASMKQLRPDMENKGSFWPPLEEMEFGSHITQMLSKQANVVVTWIWGSTFVGFAKQAKSMGMLNKMGMISWSYQDALTRAGSDIPSGIIIEADNESWTNSKNKSLYYDEFDKAYTPKRSMPPALGACQMYDIVMTLMQGVAKARGFDKDAVAKAIEGGTFMTLRGPLFMRPINHCYAAPVYFGVTKYDDKLGYSVCVDVTEVPPGETMELDSDYTKYRAEKKVGFKPWHEDWYKNPPWLQ